MTENITCEYKGAVERVVLENIVEKVADLSEMFHNDEDNMAMDFTNDDLSQRRVVIDLEVEKERLVRIIKKITAQRNRAGYQKILAFAQRENKTLIMDDCKVIIADLLIEGLVYNDSKTVNKESFKVVAKEPLNPPVELKTLREKTSTNKANTQNQDGDENQQDTLADVTAFIDNSFYDVLINRIKSEVKSCVISELNKLNVNELKVVNSHTLNEKRDADIIKSPRDEIKMTKTELRLHKEAATEKSNNELLLNNELYTEIDYLKQEIKSKNELINILAKDRDQLIKEKNKLQTIPTQSDANEVSGNTNQIVTNSNEDSDERNIEQLNNEILREADATVEFVEPKRKSKKRNIMILGDSVIKSIQPHRMQFDMSSSDKIYMKSFPGAVTSDFVHYSRPSTKYDNQVYVLHTGANDLRSTKTPEGIAKEIVGMALSLKKPENCVSISSITHRADNFKLNAKALKVNDILKSLCDANSLGFINNSNITNKHLNFSNLHLNQLGTTQLARNFLNHINA